MLREHISGTVDHHWNDVHPKGLSHMEGTLTETSHLVAICASRPLRIYGYAVTPLHQRAELRHNHIHSGACRKELGIAYGETVHGILPHPIGRENYDLRSPGKQRHKVQVRLMVAYYDRRFCKILPKRIAFAVCCTRNLVFEKQEAGHEVQYAVKIVFLLFRNLPYCKIQVNQRSHHAQGEKYEEKQ